MNVNTLTDIILVIVFALLFLISYLYFIYNSFILINISNKALSISNFDYNFQNFQLNVINLFNIYRQLLFDENSFYNEDFFENINNAIFFSYNTINSNIKFIEDYIGANMPVENLTEIYTESFCDYRITDYFDSLDECLNKFSTILNYNNLHLFINYFVEEIRLRKNIIRYLLSTGNIRGNLTNYDIEGWENDDSIPKNANNNSNMTTMFRLNLFNNDTLHSNLNILFINAILPYLDNYRKNLLEFFSVDGEEISIILLFSLYFIILIIVFFVYGYKIIKYLDSQIYKTKNILSIIPLNILIYNNNVNILNKLSQKN